MKSKVESQSADGRQVCATCASMGTALMHALPANRDIQVTRRDRSIQVLVRVRIYGAAELPMHSPTQLRAAPRSYAYIVSLFCRKFQLRSGHGTPWDSSSDPCDPYACLQGRHVHVCMHVPAELQLQRAAAT